VTAAYVWHRSAFVTAMTRSPSTPRFQSTGRSSQAATVSFYAGMGPRFIK